MGGLVSLRMEGEDRNDEHVPVASNSTRASSRRCPHLERIRRFGNSYHAGMHRDRGGVVLPLAYMLALSVQTPDPGEAALTTDFTAASYVKFFTSHFYWNVLLKTTWVAFVTTAVCAFLGFTLAVSIWLTPSRWRGLCVLAVISPLLVSIVTRAFGWMVVLGDYGLINNLLIHLGIIGTPLRLMFTNFAIVIGLVHVFLPLMTLPILTSLDRVDRNIPEAASSLGAGALTIGVKILLPMVSPGLVSGITMVFSLSMSSYILPALMGGADFRDDDDPYISAVRRYV